MSKINSMLAKWLPGDVHTLRWFENHGVGQRVTYGYSKTGAIRKIGSGVFSLPDTRLIWPGAVRALQEELSLPVHVAARTALEMQGASHNVVQSERSAVTIFVTQKIAIPSWIKDNNWNASLTFKQSSLFPGNQSLTDFKESGFKIKIASREQAILELINSLDLSKSFETAENYLSSLMTLRPTVLQDLLKICSSFKVKRVFLYLSEKLELPFFSKLSLDEINLGSGKRVIVKGGQYNKKYRITVPREESEVNIAF